MLRSGVRVVRGVAGKGLFDPGLLGTIDGASIAAAHLDSETCQGDGSEGCETLQLGSKGIDFLVMEWLEYVGINRNLG